ncbi:hypothetical protein [Haloechinothrix halophila]|uniref:hypothetical protein n=1 Tax=Haloechinothrix halophila TaxID=1069073 RepID=UPI000407515F|nr:hypothetical protein [Haloechinothrix halophila]
MNYPGGWDGQQVDPFTGDPIPHYYPSQTGYQQPQYQQGQASWQQEYGGFGMYEPPEPPKKSRGPLIAALAVGFVVLLGAGGAMAVLALRSDEGSAAASVAATAAPLPTPPSSERPSSTPGTTTQELPGEQEIRVDAVTRGWQGVWSPKDNVAYDIPEKDWEVETPSTLAGFENPNGDTAIMRGVSTYKDNYCGEPVAGWHRARVGTQTAGDMDPSKAAVAATRFWGAAAGELPVDSKKVSPTAATEVSIANGARTAYVSSAIVPMPDQTGEKCADSDKVRLSVAAFRPEPGADTIILIVYTDVGGGDELATDVSDKIIASLRPYEG